MTAYFFARSCSFSWAETTGFITSIITARQRRGLTLFSCDNFNIASPLFGKNVFILFYGLELVKVQTFAAFLPLKLYPVNVFFVRVLTHI
jgi:hypothetical protein